jgi:hypothetical protein
MRITILFFIQALGFFPGRFAFGWLTHPLLKTAVVRHEIILQRGDGEYKENTNKTIYKMGIFRLEE